MPVRGARRDAEQLAVLEEPGRSDCEPLSWRNTTDIGDRAAANTLDVWLGRRPRHERAIGFGAADDNFRRGAA